MRLSDSILIKDEDMALAINERIRGSLALSGLSVDDDPMTWKYYMNMAGEYHVTDVPMQIVSLDTMETINFNRPTLLTHRATLRAYTYDSRYYAELVNRFPNQEFLIRGILNPVNKAEAIASANYTILRYSTAEVESNETDLMIKLQHWIDSFVLKWYNRDYRITDELYGAAFMGALVANLPPAIMTIRDENAGTYRAHSFHIWNHLESNGRLSRFRNFLSTKQKLWLYRNIKWVFANAGKEYTFEKLMDIILSHRGIPVGYYEHIVNNEGLNEELYAEPIMQRTPLNLFEQAVPEPTFKSVRYVMEKQIPLARDNLRFYEDHYEDAMYRLSRSRLTRMITKTYESEVIDTSEQLPITLPEMLLNHWLYFSTNNRYPAVITVINPYTSQTMRMSVKEAFVLWLYCINRINQIELDVVPLVDAIHVKRTPVPTVQQLMGIVEERLVSRRLVEQLVAEQVPVGVMTSTEAFYDTVFEVHKTYLRHRNAFEYSQHLEARGQIQAVTDRFFTMAKCQLTEIPGESYGTYFDNRGWDFADFSAADFELLANDLFEKATGSDVRVNVSLRDVQRAMLSIMSQLGTYATQYIQTIDAAPATMIGNITIRIGDNDMEERAKIRVDRIGSNPLRMRNTERLFARMDIGKRYVDQRIGFPISKASYDLNPTVNVSVRNAPVQRIQNLISTLQFETDLAMELADTEWSVIPDLGISDDVYRKTISPSVILPISEVELDELSVTEMRLHKQRPGSQGTSGELTSVRYVRQPLQLSSRIGTRRFLSNSLTFQLAAGDVVKWVSYWDGVNYLFSVPVMSLFYPIDGVLIVDSQTTYVEHSNG